MSKIMMILVLSSLALFGADYKAFAEKMRYETSYDKAFERAKKENKKVFFLMITNYCPWCSKLEKRVLVKQEVDKAIKENYVPLIINKEEKNFPSIYKAAFTPVIFFVDAKSEEVSYTQVGYLKKSELLHLIKEDN
jgi:thioredoxin-related protein